jgi:hypothetical protein
MQFKVNKLCCQADFRAPIMMRALAKGKTMGRHVPDFAGKPFCAPRV